MITILPETRDDMLAVKASGKLTTEDYESVFIPKLEEMLTKHGKIRATMMLDESFSGMEIGAAWDDAKFGMQHRHDFEKIAVVGGPRWVEWATKIGAHLIDGDVATYDPEDYKNAVEWVMH